MFPPGITSLSHCRYVVLVVHAQENVLAGTAAAIRILHNIIWCYELMVSIFGAGPISILGTTPLLDQTGCFGRVFSLTACALQGSLYFSKSGVHRTHTYTHTHTHALTHTHAYILTERWKGIPTGEGHHLKKSWKAPTASTTLYSGLWLVWKLVYPLSPPR